LVQICTNCGEENPDRFRLCGFCGTALAPPLPAQEVRKTVTIVFSDLKGSTSLGEQLDSESLREVMSRYFDAMREILEHHGGTVEKYIGDAIMAVFGLPRIREDDALRAVRAAHAMQSTLATLNEELEQRWGVRLVNRTGVNTGEVVAGDPTTGQRLVTGDTVNVAARLEQAAPGLEVLIGDPTYRLTRDAVEVEEIEPLELKGKSERVPAYRLLSVKDEREGLLRTSQGRLVGRDDELRLLLDAYESAGAERRCVTMTLVGDAGVGKSRLTEEFLRRVGGSALTLHGRCLPYGSGITFWPVVEVVREAAGISDRDDADSARTKLSTLLGPDHTDIVERIASAVGLSETQFSVQELFWAVRKLFALLALNRPLIVAFEDLHWAQDTFLDLVEHLTDTLEGAAIVILCDARPTLLERRSAWSDRPNAAHILLEPLTAEQSEQVIANLIGGAGLDERVRTHIVETAEGNPLFVQQLLSMLIDDGLLLLEDGQWSAPDGLRDFAVPPTIQALLAARLDSLGREERAVIEPAAVAGNVFPEGAVQELAPDAVQGQVPALLAALSSKQFVRPDPAERAFEHAYRFHHVLIRETTYDGLLKRARATLHEQFVRWADRVNGDRALEYEEILGYHLEQAHRYLAELGPLDDHGRELGADGSRRLASAGHRARARGDVAAAANLLERAAAILPELDRARLALLPELGEALIDIGRFPEAETVLAEAIDAARSTGDPQLEADAGLRRLLLELRSGEVDRWSEEAGPQIAAAIEVFTEASDHAGLARAYRVLGYVHGTACNYAEAAEACERALQHAAEARDSREQRVNATSYALALCWGPTQVDDAIERTSQILEQVSGNRLSRGWVLSLLAHLRGMKGEFEGARELYRAGLAAMEEMGAGWYVAWTSLSAGRVEMLAGDYQAAERELRRGFELLDRMGERYLRSTVAALLARAVFEQGRLDEAEELTRAAEELAGAGDVETQAAWRSVRARVLARRQESEDAARLGQDALQLLLPTDSAVMKVEALADLGEVFEDLGDPSGSWALEEAIKLAELKGNVAAATQLRLALGRLPSAAGPERTAV
jgi:class 3 adenylate cyclase/tetratricopeptide (TPR) repeat protein